MRGLITADACIGESAIRKRGAGFAWRLLGQSGGYGSGGWRCFDFRSVEGLGVWVFAIAKSLPGGFDMSYISALTPLLAPSIACAGQLTSRELSHVRRQQHPACERLE